MQPRFQLPAVIALPIQGEAMMARQVNGKRLSATLRDGTKLCAQFQTGGCTGGEDCEAGRHRCAVLVHVGAVWQGLRWHSPGHGLQVKCWVDAPPSPEKAGTRPKAAAAVLKPKIKKTTDPGPHKPKQMPKAAAGTLPPLKRQRATRRRYQSRS